MKKKVLIAILVIVVLVGLFLLINYLVHKDDCCSPCDGMGPDIICPAVCVPCKGAIFK